jgi:hypothetical protein
MMLSLWVWVRGRNAIAPQDANPSQEKTFRQFPAFPENYLNQGIVQAENAETTSGGTVSTAVEHRMRVAAG